jgi:hypothetical protein
MIPKSLQKHLCLTEYAKLSKISIVTQRAHALWDAVWRVQNVLIVSKWHGCTFCYILNVQPLFENALAFSTLRQYPAPILKLFHPYYVPL